MNKKQQEAYRFTVNGTHEFDFHPETIDNLDIVESSNGAFHILVGHRSYKGKIIGSDFENKTVCFLINGTQYDVAVADKFDVLVDRMGLSNYAIHRVKDVKAPMPGLVLDVAVRVGQEVTKGDKLLILEAMKMENVIKSEGEGTVKEIHVNKGTAVDKGQLMIEMD